MRRDEEQSSDAGSFQPPGAVSKQLLIYNTKHTSCSAKQRKITLRACVMNVCVCVCESEGVAGTTLNKRGRMH